MFKVNNRTLEQGVKYVQKLTIKTPVLVFLFLNADWEIFTGRLQKKSKSNLRLIQMFI